MILCVEYCALWRLYNVQRFWPQAAERSEACCRVQAAGQLRPQWREIEGEESIDTMFPWEVVQHLIFDIFLIPTNRMLIQYDSVPV